MQATKKHKISWLFPDLVFFLAGSAYRGFDTGREIRSYVTETVVSPLNTD